MHASDRGRRRRRREACLNRDGVESRVHCLGTWGQCAGLNGKTAKNEKFYIMFKCSCGKPYGIFSFISNRLLSLTTI